MSLVITDKAYNNVDLFSRLLKDRIIFINGEITTESACDIQAQLLYLASENEDNPISIYINSPGGDVYAGLGIIDTMNLVKPDIHTICIGEAFSMAAVILAVGNERSALEHSRIMIHQPWGVL